MRKPFNREIVTPKSVIVKWSFLRIIKKYLKSRPLCQNYCLNKHTYLHLLNCEDNHQFH